MGVSIKDVAKAAGVSVSSVSRALNGYSDVNEKTRKKIQKVAEELGYFPNQSARNLSSKRKENMALIISGLNEEEKLDEFTGNIIRGVYEYINEKGSTVVTYGITSQMQKEKTLEKMCEEYSISGVILVGLKIHDEYLKEAAVLGIPCVVIDIDIDGEMAVTVTTDDEVAFEEITDYVLNQGHREVVLIKGRDEAEVTHKRCRGFEKSLKKHAVSLQNIESFECDFQEELAFQYTKEYIKKNQKRRATAFICMSDVMALGAIRAITECGYLVPEDFSVTGFDGLHVLQYIKPGLVTVDQRIREKGYIGIQVLEDMMKKKMKSNPIFVPYKLVIRESVKEL